ncbi:MAG: winged helix-turn-helix domain-containing protein, partial [Chloroflexota bacterium]
MATAEIIRVGNLNIDTGSYRLHKDKAPVKLTPTEWALLKELVQHPNQVLTHRTLLRRVWGEEYATENDYVHTYISRLRRKLEDNPANPQHILTEAGLGYRFDYEAPTATHSTAQTPEEQTPVEIATPSQRPAYINPLPQHLDGRYVGRQAQRNQLRELLLDNTRLVSIYGRAGVGKTALASTILEELQQSDEFSGMVLLSANSTGITLGRILSDFYRLLGTSPDETPEQRQIIYRITNLLDRLRNGNYVLLLDNLEQLQDPETGRVVDSDVEALLKVALEQGSTLRILATSRYPITLPHAVKIWERVISLEEGLTSEDGIALLRTSDPDGYAGLRDEDAATLAEIVQRTHALPRALEAVTGILLESPLLTPRDLLENAAMLSDELGEMFIGEAIAQLDPESVKVMELVSLFERAVPLDMLGKFAQPHLEGEALKPILNRLVRAYFLKYNPDDRTIAMHPIDRDYCYNRIDDNERQSLHAQIADLYAE